MKKLLNKLQAEELLDLLDEMYTDEVTCFLNYKEPYQLMIATILSAQCKDSKTNELTKVLFKKYQSLQSFAEASLAELTNDIISAGISNKKAGYIIDSCNSLLLEHGGNIPNTLEELTQLNGIGRKTANLLLMMVHKKDAVVVDTHVHRVSNRLGLGRGGAREVEYNIMNLIPKHRWNALSRQLVKHGREICGAKLPSCNVCAVRNICERKLNKVKY